MRRGVRARRDSWSALVFQACNVVILARGVNAAPATIQSLQALQQEVQALKTELQAPPPPGAIPGFGTQGPVAAASSRQDSSGGSGGGGGGLPAELPQFLRGPVFRPAPQDQHSKAVPSAAQEPPPSQPLSAAAAAAVPAELAAVGTGSSVYYSAPSPAAAVAAAPAAAAPAGQEEPVSQSECTCDDEEKSLQQCKLSKVIVHEDHTGTGLSMADVSAVYGGNEPMLTASQSAMAVLARVAETSFMCLDDRVTTPSMATPGGDLGEFVLALASYYQERDPAGDTGVPTQEAVNAMLLKYVTQLPPSRPVVFCTDERAVAHLESVLPAENLDLLSPPRHAMEAGLLEKMTDVESQGDSHFRLMLKRPEWYQLDEYLVPMAVKAFYSMLWKQQQDPNFPLYHSPRLKLEVLPRPEASSPQAFLEVSSGNLCHESGLAPLITPRDGVRNVLVSHLDAVSHRREELAEFFARVANATPLKIDKARLHDRLDRHGLLALEATGSRIAAGLPFYTLEYL